MLLLEQPPSPSVKEHGETYIVHTVVLCCFVCDLFLFTFIKLNLCTVRKYSTEKQSLCHSSWTWTGLPTTGDVMANHQECETQANDAFLIKSVVLLDPCAHFVNIAPFSVLDIITQDQLMHFTLWGRVWQFLLKR